MPLFRNKHLHHVCMYVLTLLMFPCSHLYILLAAATTRQCYQILLINAIVNVDGLWIRLRVQRQGRVCCVRIVMWCDVIWWDVVVLGWGEVRCIGLGVDQQVTPLLSEATFLFAWVLLSFDHSWVISDSLCKYRLMFVYLCCLVWVWPEELYFLMVIQKRYIFLINVSVSLQFIVSLRIVYW